MQERDGNFSWIWAFLISRHQQLKDRLDEELALEAKAEENLKARARLFGSIVFRIVFRMIFKIFATFVMPFVPFVSFCAFSGV